MSGWGSGAEGTSRWGIGDEPIGSTPPTIVALDPLENASGIGRTRPISARISDDSSIDPTSIFVAINGVYQVLAGGAVNGANYFAVPNNFNGYDITVTPATPFPAASRPDVHIYATNDVPLTTVKVYSFTVGVGPRLLVVRNPAPGVLLADFNVAMDLSATFLDAGNWVVSPVSAGALPLTITGVTANSLSPSRATLSYEGGGSIYELVAYNVRSRDGEELEAGFDRVRFDLIYGAEAELQIRLFDSIFGPLGISQREVARHSVERHTADRSLALALDEQLRLRFQQLDDTAGRDGRPGKLRGA
jgi:hypothetical protein